ncbi:MAG: hypothetical protein ACFFCW_35065, partial [Candidatus Hodarchaeota archaeon]
RKSKTKKPDNPQLSVISRCSLLVVRQSSIVSRQSSVVIRQSSVVSHYSSFVTRPSSIALLYLSRLKSSPLPGLRKKFKKCRECLTITHGVL